MANYLIIGMFVMGLSSCMEGKEVPRVIFPEGFFLVKNDLYYSDGSRFYCTFKNWEHLYLLRGTKKKPETKIIEQDVVPSGMRFIKYCNSGILTPKFYQ